MSVHKEVPKKDQPRIDTAGLVERILKITRTFVDSHHADVGIAEQGTLDARDGIVAVGIGTARPGFHLQNAQLESTERTGEFRAAVDRHLLAGHRVNPNLTREKQLVPVADIEAEDPRVFQEELTLFGNEDLEGCQIELLQIYVRVSEIRISRNIQNKIRTEAILDIEPARKRELGFPPGLFVIGCQPVWLYNEELSAPDVGDAAEFPSLRNLRNSERSPVGAPQVLFVFSANESLEIQSPDDVLRLREIQSREGNLHSCRPPVRGNQSFRGPHPIPSRIEI